MRKRSLRAAPIQTPRLHSARAHWTLRRPTREQASSSSLARSVLEEGRPLRLPKLRGAEGSHLTGIGKTADVDRMGPWI